MALYQRVHTVEAEQITRENVEAVAAWCNGIVVEEIDAQDDSKKYPAITFPNLSGNQRAGEGDYVVKDAGGFYRWEQERFLSLFKKVNI